MPWAGLRWYLRLSVNPVRNFSGALAAQALAQRVEHRRNYRKNLTPPKPPAQEGLPPGQKPLCGGAWPGGSSGALSKYARIPPSFAGGMNGLPSPLGGEGLPRGVI